MWENHGLPAFVRQPPDYGVAGADCTDRPVAGIGDAGSSTGRKTDPPPEHTKDTKGFSCSRIFSRLFAYLVGNIISSPFGFVILCRCPTEPLDIVNPVKMHIPADDWHSMLSSQRRNPCVVRGNRRAARLQFRSNRSVIHR